MGPEARDGKCGESPAEEWGSWAAGETVPWGRVARVQAEVVDSPTVSAQDTHLPGRLAQLGGRLGWGPPYKARAGNAGPHRLRTAPLPCPPRSRQAPDPGSSGLPPPSPPTLASGCSWGDSPWPSIDTAEALPCCWPWGPPRWPGGPCEQVPQGRPRGLCRVLSQERWFQNSSSGLGQGRSPCPDPPRASAGVRVREPPRASPPLVLECSSSSSPTFPLLWREALFGPVPALGGRRGALPPLAPGARASSSPFPSRGVCFSPLPSRRRAS